MTYRGLLTALLNLNNEQLDQDVTVNVFDEYYAAELVIVDESQDVLDPGHPCFVSVYPITNIPSL